MELKEFDEILLDVAYQTFALKTVISKTAEVVEPKGYVAYDTNERS